MKYREKQRMGFRGAPENGIGFIIPDLLLVVAGFALTSFLFNGTMLSTSEAVIAMLCGGFAVLFFFGFDLYASMHLKLQPILVSVILSAIYTFLCSSAVLFLFNRSTDELLFLTVGTVLSFLLLGLWRAGLWDFLRKYTRRPKLLMVEMPTDQNTRTARLAASIRSRYNTACRQLPAGDSTEIQTWIKLNLPHYDVICLMETIPAEIRTMFMEACLHMNKELLVVPSAYEMNFAKVKPEYLDDAMVFHLPSPRISPIQRFGKRAMDLILSSAALAVVWIPMCIIALIIKLDSPGPIFYKQLRLTRGKKEFYIYKFRSMVQNAEAKTGPALATKDDPRITKVGRWLRKLRLDELPQLINILMGDMSIVGPRPERPFFVQQYEKEIPDYDRRFQMKAGLTALSHVYGRYSTDIIDRTHYDLLYVQNYSLLMDLRIMLLTSRTLFLSDAAEGIVTED